MSSLFKNIYTFKRYSYNLYLRHHTVLLAFLRNLEKWNWILWDLWKQELFLYTLIQSIGRKSKYLLCGSHCQRHWGARDSQGSQTCTSISVMLDFCGRSCLGGGSWGRHNSDWSEVKLSKASWRKRHLSCICEECGRAFKQTACAQPWMTLYL